MRKSSRIGERVAGLRRLHYFAALTVLHVFVITQLHHETLYKNYVMLIVIVIQRVQLVDCCRPAAGDREVLADIA